MARGLTICRIWPALATLLLVGCEPNPTTYEDCVLENVQAAKTTAAASIIRGVCREKFPKPTEHVNILDALELDKDKWRAVKDGDVIRVIPVDPETGLADPFSEGAHTLREMPEGFDPFSQPPEDKTSQGQGARVITPSEAFGPKEDTKADTEGNQNRIESLIKQPYGGWE